MEFRLLYSGRLLGSSKADTRADMKHAIRREFHPQMKRLWSTNHGLQHMKFVYGIEHYNAHPADFPATGTMDDKERRELFANDGIKVIGQQWARIGYQFIPLVTKDMELRCSLDILLLRPDQQRYVIQSGDLDAKVKTIFDALRIPDNLAEADGMGPQDDETPFYCLLQDDKLISEIRVSTDELLTLPKEKSVSPNDAFLIVHVKLRPTRRTKFSHVFETGSVSSLV